MTEVDMRRITGLALGLVVGVLGLAAAARADTITLNGGFEDGTGSTATGWTAVQYNGWGPFPVGSSDGRRVTSLGSSDTIFPLAGSYMGFVSNADTDLGVVHGLRSDSVDVTGAYFTFSFNFLSDFEWRYWMPPDYGADTMSLIIRSTGAGAPADRTVELAEVVQFIVSTNDSGGGYLHSAGFKQRSYYVGDRFGFATTFEFSLQRNWPSNALAAALIDNVGFTDSLDVSPVPIPPAAWSGVAMLVGLAGWGWVRSRRERDAE